MKYYSVIFLLNLFILSSCNPSKWDISLSKQNPEIKYHYFYQDFYNPEVSLKFLKEEYPILFPESIPDSLTNQFRNDTLNLKSFHKTTEVYYKTEELEKTISKILKRLNYYYPNLNQFQVYFSVGFFEEYTQPILYNAKSGDIFIALDLFLEPNFENYTAQRIPSYYQQNMNPEHLYSSLALEIAEQLVLYNPKKQSFLDQMIYEGKKMLMVDALLPKEEDWQKIGFTPEQLKWCKDNEPEIYNYFVENDILYSNDFRHKNRFLQYSPYSKFGTEAEQDSPGRTAVWMGWQISRNFFKDMDVKELPRFLLNTDYQTIFQQSKYKPL